MIRSPGPSMTPPCFYDPSTELESSSRPLVAPVPSPPPQKLSELAVVTPTPRMVNFFSKSERLRFTLEDTVCFCPFFSVGI